MKKIQGKKTYDLIFALELRLFSKTFLLSLILSKVKDINQFNRKRVRLKELDFSFMFGMRWN